jgi:hypothetical protein
VIVVVNSKFFSLVVLFIVVLSGCREDEKVTAYRQLRTLHPAEIERRVAALSPQDQVDMYAMAISYFRPSDTQLATVLAKQGTKILPALVAKLEKAESDVPPQELVLVLNMMVIVYHVDEAKAYAPRVDEWCSRFYKGDSYCHQMGREMAEKK